MGETEFFHAGQGGARLFGQTFEQGFDLVADLIALLVGGSYLIFQFGFGTGLSA